MTSPKNVLWIMADQLRGQALGFAGDPNVHTPHLDRFAAEGHTFTRAVAGAPLCCPARGSMLTGRYPCHSGVAGHRHPMPADTRTVAGELAAAGYRTCWIGKWHLDGDRPELGDEFAGEGSARVRMIPPERRGGFEDWWAYENNNRPFDCLVHTDTGRVPPGAAIQAETDGMQRFRLGGYETDALTDLLIAWLRDQVRNRPEQPFFGVLSVQPPHDPYVAPAETMGRHTPGGIRLRPNVPPIPQVQERARRDLAGYYAAIERIDHDFGRIRAALSELGIADDTYVVFLSDHGDMHGSHGQWRKTAPWEESIRVPFVIGGPSREHMTAHRLDEQINQVDLAPTTLGLCGIEPPAWMEGADHSPLLHGMPADLPGSTYFGIPVPTGHNSSIDRAWQGVLTADGWKYVCFDDQPWLLFNLAEDPYELANHAHDPGYRADRERLHGLLLDWANKATG